MTILQNHIDYWKETASRDMKTAESLFDLKRYDSCLFFCHLSLEKLLKGLVVMQTKESAPYIHNLKKLAKLAKLNLTEENWEMLIVITDFNISGRYPEVKLDFYKKCNKRYTEKYLKISKEMYLWLKKEYQKN